MTNDRPMQSFMVPWRTVTAYMVCSVLVGLMVSYRYWTTGTLHYAWLVIPNLLLAWIPLGLAVSLQYISASRSPGAGVSSVLGLLWLLFFPNAPYMITDLVHLTWVADNISVHFDTALVFLSAFTGLGLGFSSLDIIQNLVRKRYDSLGGWLFVSLVWVVSSVGIYLGRVQRWNSWDALRSPLSVFAGVIAAMKGGESLLIMSVYAVVPMALYVAFRLVRDPHGRGQASGTTPTL